MLQIRARRWLILPLVCVFFDGTLVAGQDQSGRLDVLKGNNGENSCQLRDTIHSTCNLITPPPSLNVSPIPSLCTCNKVYFNVWSACSYATGNSTLPIFQNWTQTCTSKNVDLDSSTATANTNGGLGIDIPAWSLLDVPGNRAFDIQRAVSLVSSSTSKWSKFQILAPVISAVVAALMTFVFVFYCRPRASQTNWRGRIHDLIRPVPRMKPLDPPTIGRNWAIDDVYEPTRIPPPMIDPLSPMETNRITDISNPNNPSAPPSKYDRFKLTEMTEDAVRSNIPGGRAYPFAPRYPLNNPHASQPPSAPTSTTTSLLRRLPRNIRLPWKLRPTPIRVIQPNARFRVDHRQESLQNMSSAGTQDSITSWGPEHQRGSFDVHEHEDNQENMNVGTENQTDDQVSDEGTSLISQSQRERMSLQTNQAHSSSINSHVKVVAPSNSSSSPMDPRPGSSPFPFLNRNPPPEVPPPPTQPAPQPPSGQRTVRREYNIAQLPPDRLMATIQENEYRTPSPLSIQSISHKPRPSIDSPRPLPQPANTSPLSRSDLLSAHQRSNSQTGSASSVYEENSLTGYAASTGSRPPHSRSGSGDSQASPHRSRPLPTHTNNNIPLPNRGMPQSNYPPPAHQRSGSGSSFSALYQDPFAPTSHGRGLDWEADDDGASFYLEPTESPRPVRSPSPDDMLGDPAMLFHPSVRGAGYRGTPY